MKSSKARDFFSAYREGTLESGLRDSFERQLASDSALQADFARFNEALDSLETGTDEQIEVPFGLHDRISAAIDKNLWEQRRREQSGLGSWWRSLAYSGVAALAIIGAIATIQNSQRPGVAAAGMMTGSNAAPSLAVVNDTLRLIHENSKDRIVILNADSGEEIWRTDARGRSVDLPLVNRSEDSVAVEITVGSRKPMLVCVPGTSRDALEEGSGMIDSFVRSLCDRYGVPVVLQVADTGREMEWKFDSNDALTAADTNAKALGLSVELRDSGVLVLTD